MPQGTSDEDGPVPNRCAGRPQPRACRGARGDGDSAMKDANAANVNEQAALALKVLASAAAAACESEGYDKPMTFGGLCSVIDYALTHVAVRKEQP